MEMTTETKPAWRAPLTGELQDCPWDVLGYPPLGECRCPDGDCYCAEAYADAMCDGPVVFRCGAPIKISDDGGSWVGECGHHHFELGSSRYLREQATEAWTLEAADRLGMNHDAATDMVIRDQDSYAADLYRAAELDEEPF